MKGLNLVQLWHMQKRDEGTDFEVARMRAEHQQGLIVWRKYEFVEAI